MHISDNEHAHTADAKSGVDQAEELARISDALLQISLEREAMVERVRDLEKDKRASK
jgi:hypothetical protein